MKRRLLVSIAAAAVAVTVIGQVGEAWARAGSGGSRGSRSYSAPARPGTPGTPTSPSRTMTQPSPSTPTQRPGFLGGLGGAIAGFALGGLLGGLLFGGFGGFGHGFGGIGMFDILLIVGGIAALMYFLRRRRQSETPAYATAGTSQYGATRYAETETSAAPFEAPAARAQRADLDVGVQHIGQMDPAFDPIAFADWTRTQFAAVQSAVATRDVNVIRDRLSAEMYGVLLTQCEELKAARRRNVADKIDLTRVEVTEAWQERGQDFVTVYLDGTMLDYTVDEASGQVVDGSKTVPANIDEFWTFARPVGPNKWKLSAIQRG
jgi:predicted lipid-binding transport protein (Tim44 family)